MTECASTTFLNGAVLRDDSGCLLPLLLAFPCPDEIFAVFRLVECRGGTNAGSDHCETWNPLSHANAASVEWMCEHLKSDGVSYDRRADLSVSADRKQG